MRSKKKDSGVSRVAGSARLLVGVVLMLLVVLGLSYMWLNARCEALGREIKHQEKALAEAEKRWVNEQDRWSYMTSPANLRRAIQRYRLAMVMPEENQIVRVRYRGLEGDSLAYAGDRRRIQRGL